MSLKSSQNQLLLLFFSKVSTAAEVPKSSCDVRCIWLVRWWCCPRPARRSICTAAAHQRRAPPLRKYSQLDARQTAGSSQLAISVQILCKLQRPRHGGGQRAVWDNSYLRTSHTYHHNHIMMLSCAAPLSVSCSRVTPHHLLVWLDSTAGTGCSPVAGRWNVASGDCWGAVVQTVDSRYCVETVLRLCRNCVESADLSADV